MTILVAGNCGSLTETLAAAGHEVSTAATGTAALERVEAGGVTALVLSILLPGSDALTVCRRIREDVRWKALPVVIRRDFPLEGDDPELVRAIGADLYAGENVADADVVGEIERLLQDGRPDSRPVTDPEASAVERHHTALLGRLLDSRLMAEAQHAERLRETEGRTRAVVETAADAIIAIDTEDRIIFANSAAAEMTGYTEQGLSGRSVRDLIPERHRDAHTEGMRRYMRTGEPRMPSWRGVAFTVLRADGRELPVEVTLGEHALGSERWFIGVLRDISERLRDEQRLQRINRMYAMLSACNHVLLRTEDETALLEKFVESVVGVGGYRFAWVGYAEHDAERNIRPVARAGVDDGYLEAIRITWSDAPEGRGPGGRAIRSGETQVIEDMQTAEIMTPWREQANARGYRSMVALPMNLEGRRLGVLCIYADQSGVFSEEEVGLLEELTGDLAFGIQALRVRQARQRAEAELRLTHRALEASNNGVIITDARADDHPVIYANPAFSRITGYGHDEIVGRNPRFIMGSELDQPALDAIRAALREGRSETATVRTFRKDGSEVWCDTAVSPVFDEQGALTHFVGISTDITERVRYEYELEYQTNHDLLTGLANRSLLLDRLSQGLTFAERHGHGVAVVVIDLDRFKHVNDTAGHAVGDELLREVARSLTELTGRADTVARLGADEFVVLLTELDGPDEALRRAYELRSGVGRVHEVLGQRIAAPCSLGVSYGTADGGQPDALLRHAETAMYRAKEIGGGEVVMFSDELTVRTTDRVRLESALREALARRELQVYFQPQFQLADDALAGAEALARWHHPERGWISPAEFIPVAEETGLIVQLGRFVLERACEQLAAWDARGIHVPRLAVNVSGLQVQREDLVRDVAEVLAATGISPDRLELEVTESFVMRRAEAAIRQLNRLSRMGVHVAVDDFGTGYSSLSYLKRLPVNRLKLDKSFVRDIPGNAHDEAIARAVIALGKSMALEVVAEGVETERQKRFLRLEGCDVAQGFLYGRPLPAEELESSLIRGVAS
ncbi:EAL domain-containing protein [Ectothiorhodospiraceae bacterium WFHF3C12]|nr:EAL domain-containing protein [Ectothiorhodospiraceae bacterium WFHF3C12]